MKKFSVVMRPARAEIVRCVVVIDGDESSERERAKMAATAAGLIVDVTNH